MRSSKFKDSNKSSNNGSLFYQAFNNTSSIISYEPSSSSRAVPQFNSSHLDVSARKILAHSTATTKTAPKDEPLKQTGGLKRARVDEGTPSTTAASSTTLSILDKPPIFDLYSLMKRTRNESTASSNVKQPVSSSLSSSISVISSETRRLLRELERRNSPITAAKRMKQDESDIKNFRPSSAAEPEISTRSSITRPPPTSSLVTPYRAHVLPRLATLGRSPYARPLKETADKGISVDMSQETVTSTTLSTSRQDPGALASKVGTKIKVPGGSRNKFSTQFLDEEEPQIVYESDYNKIPQLPLNRLPSVGFLTSKSNQNHKKVVDDGQKSSFFGGITGTPTLMTSSTTCTMTSSLTSSQRLSRSGSQSPTVGTFLFSNPIVIANPAETSFTTPKTTTNLENGPLTTKTTTIATNGPVKSTSEVKWTCTTCFISNPGNEANCMACGASKPGEKKQISLPGFSATKMTTDGAVPQSANWSCTTCFISNPNSETNCMACDSSKPGEKKQTSGPPAFSASKFTATGAIPQTMNFGFKPAVTSICTTPPISTPTLIVAPVTATVPPVLVSSNSIAKPLISFPAATTTATANWTCTTCFISNPSTETKCMACSAPKSGEKKESSSFPSFSATKITTTGVVPQSLDFGFKPTVTSISITASPPISTPTLSIAPDTATAPVLPPVVSSESIAKPLLSFPAVTTATSSIFSPPTTSTPATTSAFQPTSTAGQTFGSGFSFQFGNPSANLTSFGAGPATFQATSTASSLTSSSSSIFSLPATSAVTAPVAKSTFQTTSSTAPTFGSDFSFQFSNPSTTLPSFSSGLGPFNSISTTSPSSIFSPPTTSAPAPATTSAFQPTSTAGPTFGSGFSFQFGNPSANLTSFGGGLGTFQATSTAPNLTSSSSSIFSVPATSVVTAPAATSAFQTTSSAAPTFGSGFSFQFGGPSTTLSSFSSGLGPFNSIPTNTSSTSLFSTPTASVAAPAAPAHVFGAGFSATSAPINAPFSNLAGPAAPPANIFSINKTSSGSASAGTRKTLTAKRKTGRGH